MAREPLMPFRPGFGLMGGSDPFLSLYREMNRIFDTAMRTTNMPLIGSQGQNGLGTMLDASMNVSETENEIRVTAELPGVAEQDVDISLDDDVLTIRGEKKIERQDDKENFHVVERSYGTFQRALRLPAAVRPEEAQAKFENGVLTVTLAKAAQQDRSRRIRIQGSSKQIEGEASSSGNSDQKETGGSEQRSDS